MDNFPKKINSGEVSSFEAKTNLSSLLEYTSEGKEFLITRRGKPIARLIPAEKDQSKELVEVLKMAHEFRKKITKPVSIINLRDKGRKY
jgi:prevent-host-death family protein